MSTYPPEVQEMLKRINEAAANGKPMTPEEIAAMKREYEKPGYTGTVRVVSSSNDYFPEGTLIRLVDGRIVEGRKYIYHETDDPKKFRVRVWWSDVEDLRSDAAHDARGAFDVQEVTDGGD